MPRIRSIKPDFFKSEDVSALALRPRLTWIGLWTQCDDHGRYKDSARLIKGDLWSLDDVSLSDIEEDLAALAAAKRIVRYEVHGSIPPTGQLAPGAGRYLAIVNWHEHQAINRPSRAKYPGPPSPLGATNPDDPNYCAVCAAPNPIARLAESSLRAHGVLTEPSVNGSGSIGAGQGQIQALTEPSVSTHGGLTPGKEGKGKEGKGGDVRARAREKPPAPDGLDPHPPEPRCPKHLNDPNPPACGQCADARKARNRWESDRAHSSAAAPRCPTHRGEPAHNCAPCRSERLAPT